MRVLDLPVSARLGPNGRLLGFTWRGRRYTVRERLDLWREVGAWWEGEPEKTFLVVRTEPPGLFELYCAMPPAVRTPAPGEEGRPAEPTWHLYKVYD